CTATGGAGGLVGSGAFPGSNGSKGASRGGNIANGGVFTLFNSILATNLAGLNAYGTIVDEGYNISSDSTPSSLSGTSRKNTNSKIGPLANNGGPTKTMALLSTNSPAYEQVPTNGGGFPAID